MFVPFPIVIKADSIFGLSSHRFGSMANVLKYLVLVTYNFDRIDILDTVIEIRSHRISSPATLASILDVRWKGSVAGGTCPYH